MKKILISAIFLCTAVFFSRSGFAEDPLTLHHQGKKIPPRSSTVPARAADQAVLDQINTKLDQLLAAQQTILSEYENLKKELSIIKIRASR